MRHSLFYDMIPSFAVAIVTAVIVLVCAYSLKMPAKPKGPFLPLEPSNDPYVKLRQAVAHDEFRELIRTGKLIEAIQFYMKTYGTTSKEAGDAVTALAPGLLPTNSVED